jgi:hypothetical protein
MPGRGNYYLSSRRIAAPGPVAVNVYTVVVDGVTLRSPLSATLPTPLSMLIVVALETDQFSFAASPVDMLSGDAENWLITEAVAVMYRLFHPAGK